MKSAALFVVRSPLASMCVGAVLVGLYWASVIVLDGASRGLLAASFLILGTGIGCFTFLCVSQPGWVKENYRSLLTTKNVRLLKHPLVWTSVGRCGSLLMVAGLIWSEGAVVTLLISTGVLVYIPLRNMSSEVVDGGGDCLGCSSRWTSRGLAGWSF